MSTQEFTLIEKKLDFLLKHVEELKLLWLKSDTTSASVKKRYFSGKKYLGSKDKKVIGGCFYFYLRTKLFTDKLTIKELLLLSYINVNEVKESIDKLFKNIDFLEFLSSIIDNSDDVISDFNTQKHSVFFPETYKINIKTSSIDSEELFKSLNEEATTDLRIISNSDVIEEELTASGASYFFNLLNDCIKLEKNINFNSLISYKNGYFDIQDEGSQLVSFFLNPKNGDNILDYCSGGGGKTIHIAELSHDSANITATDIDTKRLQETERRVSFHRYSSVRILEKNDVDNSTKQFNKILVDAPCSGSGTVRRSPEIRYSITEDSIKTYSDMQKSILEACYAKLQPGGELVYSTCSLFFKENDEVIKTFLDNHDDLSLIDIRNRVIGLQLDESKFDLTDYGLMTLANKTKTDGFFISVLSKSL